MSERIQINNEFLPLDLQKFWARARVNTYAGDATPIPGITSPGSTGFRYHEEKSDLFYIDEFHTHSKIPGRFIGGEAIRQGSYMGLRSGFYHYAGGLTEEGLKLGEETVYGVLKKVLKERAEVVRFGNRVMIDIEGQGGNWQYEGYGSIKPWSWEDRERITLNHALLYEFVGTGVCFVG